MYLIHDDSFARDTFFSQNLQEPSRFPDGQDCGYCSNDKLCRFFVPEQVSHHDDTFLQCPGIKLNAKLFKSVCSFLDEESKELLMQDQSYPKALLLRGILIH